jgi:hypothetical protein
MKQTLNIIVLDYSAGTVTIYRNVEFDEPTEMESWLEAHTVHHMKNCHFMCTENEIEIQEGEL